MFLQRSEGTLAKYRHPKNTLSQVTACVPDMSHKMQFWGFSSR